MTDNAEPTAENLIRMFQAGLISREQFFDLAKVLSEDETVSLARLILQWVEPPEKKTA